MKTDVITVSGKGQGMETALKQADLVAQYKGMAPKDALHLRLLTEEMMGLMRSITGKTDGLFWIEDEDGVYRLHLRVETRLSSEKREQLISASRTGKNESAKGLMGRLRDFFDWGSDEELATFSSSMYMPDIYDHSTSPTLDWEWSMVKYEKALSEAIGKDDAAARDAWDELEKSVVRNVADDVKVFIRGGAAEMVIIKKMG